MDVMVQFLAILFFPFCTYTQIILLFALSERLGPAAIAISKRKALRLAQI